MTDFDAKRLFSPNGIPEDEWTDEVKEAVRLVNSHSYSDIAREVLAFGEYKAKLAPQIMGFFMFAAAMVAVIIVPVIMKMPSLSTKLMFAVFGLLAVVIPLVLYIGTLGRYTYVVTNAHVILYKGRRSKVNRWVSFGEYSSAELTGNSIRIRSGRMIPRPDEPSPYKSGNEMYNMTLRGLDDSEAERISSAIEEALNNYRN